MADNKFTFQFDAGKLLAKLHAGGMEACGVFSRNDVKVYNTGIKNNAKKTPVDCDSTDMTFDFDNDTGVYELGVVIASDAQFPYSVEDFEGQKQDTKQEVKDARKEVDEKSSITDGAEEIDKKKDEAAADAKEKGGDDLKDKKSENKEAFDDYIQDARKTALDFIKAYMLKFAGKAQSDRLNDGSLTQCWLDDSVADPFKVKSYAGSSYIIPTKDSAAANTERVKYLSDNPKKKSIKIDNLCFKIGYSVDIKES